MLTARNDRRLWNPWLLTTFAHLPRTLSAPAARRLLHEQLTAVRKLRNRVAHHEPIFAYEISAEYRRISKIISWRSPETACWLSSIETVSDLLNDRP
jgi:hypothetical protein